MNVRELIAQYIDLLTNGQQSVLPEAQLIRMMRDGQTGGGYRQADARIEHVHLLIDVAAAAAAVLTAREFTIYNRFVLAATSGVREVGIAHKLVGTTATRVSRWEAAIRREFQQRADWDKRAALELVG